MYGILVNCFEKEVMYMTWTKLWLDLFGTTTLWGINMGFWVALAAVALIVIGMNVVFWSMKPLAKGTAPAATPVSEH